MKKKTISANPKRDDARNRRAFLQRLLRTDAEKALQMAQQMFAKINMGLPAGAPMFFACAECAGPIMVPECYVAKPRLCPDCGGQWSTRLCSRAVPE